MLCPTGWPNFYSKVITFQRSDRPEQPGADGRVVLSVVTAVVSAIRRAIRRRRVGVVEHPTRSRGKPHNATQQQTHNRYGDAT